jgi:hypothetical protein
MSKPPRAIVVFWLIFTSATHIATARAEQAAARPQLRAVRVSKAPVIDGVLDDDAWTSSVQETGEWKSYNPLYGDTIPQHTTVWIAYDSDSIYFAFKCDDPQPAGIKTSITRRDNIWQDDWVGLSLDALGTGQQSYHMMVNPSGVQLDMLNSVAGGEDESPDWVWDSAGRLTDTGYNVEIRLPLQSIRFAGGRDAAMGILFWRRISRVGVSVSWPALTASTWVFDQHATLRFPEIAPRLPREMIPSVTLSRTDTRDTPSRWSTDGTGDVGFGAKWGLTSTVTLDATVNPDFSQVESDAFQVEVNQRFPLFFSEKRPFFMEGAGIFTLAGTGAGGDQNLLAAVHTRRIVDPIAGAKLTGSAKRLTFATLSAVDEAPGRAADPGSLEAGKDRIFNIARAQVSLGPANYIGGIVTDTRFSGGHNTVVGADATWRLSPSQRINGFLLDSFTRDRDILCAAGSGVGTGADAGMDVGTADASSSGAASDAGGAEAALAACVGAGNGNGNARAGSASGTGSGGTGTAGGAGADAGADSATGSGVRLPGASRSGLGAELTYSYNTNRISFEAQAEHFDRAFQMDTAFLNRVGFTAARNFFTYNFFPDKAKTPWLRRVMLLAFTQADRDRIQRGDSWLNVSGARFNFTRQGFLRVDRATGREAFAGQRFQTSRWRAFGNVQLYRWLYLNGNINHGYATFYDPTAPYQGRSTSTTTGFTLQPNGRLSQEISYQRVSFDRADTAARVYTLDILYSRTTYQFTRQFFLRGIEQYDSSQRRILTDFLASYQLRPGTVVYAGYGSLLERRTFENDQWLAGQGDYLTTRRGLFFKASYLYRF